MRKQMILTLVFALTLLATAGQIVSTAPISANDRISGERATAVRQVAAPQNLKAAAVGAGEVYLTWDGVATAAGYRVYRDGALVGQALAAMYADDGLAASTTYRYTVTAYESGGLESGHSNEASTSTGAVITATSCQQTDVQAAVNAARDGDTVAVPAGSVTWTTPAQYTPAVIISDKAITLQGAGMGRTLIQDGTVSGWRAWALLIEQPQGKPFRVTGFSFTGATQVADELLLVVEGNSQVWRIDHCGFADFPGDAIINIRRSPSFGVIDHCFFDISRSGQPIQATSDNEIAWQKPLALGTAQAIYIEDNAFYCRRAQSEQITDGNAGARFVMRYNVVDGGAGFHNHGRDSGGPTDLGTLSYEVYENTITNWTGYYYGAMDSRSGTGVIFNNIVEGNFGAFMYLYNYCSCAGHSGVCPNWDQCTAYPCPCQIGRAPDTNSDGVQELEPLYSWGNQARILGNEDRLLQVPAAGCSAMHDHIKEGRDYYNNTSRPGYAPYAYPHPLAHPAIPEAPASLAAKAVSSSQIELRWVSHSSVEKGFKVERSADGIAFAEVADVRHDKTIFTDSGLAPYTTYLYRIYAYNDQGRSGYSNTAMETTHETCYIGPLAYYPFEGNANDATGHGYDGTAQGGASLAGGALGQAYRFGVGDYISVTPTLGPIQGANQSFSFLAWVKTADTSGNHWILADDTTYSHFVFGLFGGKLFLEWLYEGSHRVFVYSGQQIAGDFTHVAATYDRPSQRARIYINGAPVVTDTTSLPLGINDITQLQIGRGYWQASPEYWNGIIDEVQVYDYALSPDQILSVYQHGGIVIDEQDPTAPQNLQAVARSSSQIDLSWSPATDNVGVKVYKIYRNGGTFPVATTFLTTYSDTNLDAHTAYTYTVSAYDAAGNESGPSNVASATTAALTLYGAPGDKTIYLNWTVENLTLPITATWQIDYISQTGSAYLPVTGLISTTRAYTLTNLTNGVWYTVTLSAMQGSAAILTDSVRVMPTGGLVYLPLVLRQ